MSSAFGPPWVDRVMDPIKLLRLDAQRNRGTREEPDYRNPYNRIYEAVARCESELQATQLVQAILDVRSDGMDAVMEKCPRCGE